MLEDGVYPAMVTPMDPVGAVDDVSVVKLMTWFSDCGCEGAVVAGTNGEGPSLSAPEKRDLVRLASSHRPTSAFRIILGVSTPSLYEAQWLVAQAAKVGADAILLMPPSYFREAASDGIVAWFRAILDAARIPILLYNFPQRTGFTLGAREIEPLAKHPNLGGMKDSSGNVENLSLYRSLVEGKLFVGNELLLWDALLAGWNGTISGAANVVPRWLCRVVANRDQTAFELVKPTLEKIRSLPQPASHKALLASWKIINSPAVRLPLLPAESPEIPLAQP